MSRVINLVLTPADLYMFSCTTQRNVICGPEEASFQKLILSTCIYVKCSSSSSSELI